MQHPEQGAAGIVPTEIPKGTKVLWIKSNSVVLGNDAGATQ